MKLALTTAFVALMATPILAQELTDEELAQQILEDLESYNEDVIPTNTLGKTVSKNYAQLRLLDRLNGAVEMVELTPGNTIEEQQLQVTLKSCFVPADSAASDAIAFLEIQDKRENSPRFDGWMVASSPALSALEHPRYDVWVVSCTDQPKLEGQKELEVPPERPIEFTIVDTSEENSQ